MPVFWRDYVRPSEHLATLRERRRDVYERIDEQKFGWKIVIVAGAGFLTDAYDIFAVNMVLPMLEIVYWQNKLPAHEETAINLATLIGTIIGQLAFGIFADRYGRKKMYGFELLIVIVATVGLALCSKGARGSVNILAWVISWRVFMGIGIGADYPLSAVIVSEFSPRKHRARMLATVFYMQPVGQFLANIVAIIATALSHRYISHDSDPSNCVGDCMETTDKIWRWIVGLGAVVPALALLARLFIPESPRYLLEVEMDSHTAQENANKYFTNPTDPFQEPDQDDEGSNHFEGAVEPLCPRDADGGDFAAQDGSISMEKLSRRQDQVLGGGPPMSIANGHAVTPPTGDPDAIKASPRLCTDSLMPGNPGTKEATPKGGYTRSSPGSSIGKDDVVVETHSVVPLINHNGQCDDDREQPRLAPSQQLNEPTGNDNDVSGASRNPSINHDGQCDDDREQPRLAPSQQLNEPTGNDNDVSGASRNPQENTKTRRASWKEFRKGFHDFLFKPDSPNVSESEGENTPPQLDGHVEPNGSAAPGRHWTDGNWTDLAGTSLAWFLLDFSYYFLGVNSWKVIANVWDTPAYKSVYQLVIQFSWRALVSVSVSSMIGGALFIAMAKYRYNLQTYGFLTLAAFLIAVGATFVTLLGGRYFAAIIVLYFFTQLFFDLGPNTSTFIIPAEVFPTQYRATCHGISAASGKLGSIIAQIIAQVYLHGNHSKRLGYALILFSVAMILGAFITKFWVPNPCDIYGESRSLEDLSNGKRARKKMEEDEKIELRRAEQARYGNV